MSPSRRASSDSEVESPEPKDSAALSNWLVSDLVPPPEEPEPPPAPEGPIASGEPASTAVESAPITPESSLIPSPDDVESGVDADADPPDDPDGVPTASDDDELDPMDEFYPVESIRPSAETATLTPQWLPTDDVAPPESPESPEAVLGAILGSTEARARRARRVKMAAAGAGALVTVLLGYVLFSGNGDPQIDVIELKVPPPGVAAEPEDDRIEALETPPAAPEESDVASDVEQRKARGAVRSTSEPFDPEPARAGAHYGPSVARYPDLPRDVLITLEEQQQSRSPKPAPTE